MGDKGADIEVIYWPVPFRGNVIKLLLEDAEIEYRSIEENIEELRNVKVSEQEFPWMAPPAIRIKSSNFFLNQLPAIIFYLGKKYGYEPDSPEQTAIAMKVVLDCNDILEEITCHGGTTMWSTQAWNEWTEGRFKKWLSIFEEIGNRNKMTKSSGYLLGGDSPSYADIFVFWLIAGIEYSFPSLVHLIQSSSPKIHALATRMEGRPRINVFLKKQREEIGSLWCGGQIEESIIKMTKNKKS